MPYKSDKQRRFMHAQHPGIASRWDAEIRGKKKGKVSKAKTNIAREVASTAVDQGRNAISSAPDLKQKVKASRKRLRKIKGQFQKAYTPTSTDPLFNHQAARNAFNLVMKMDDESAEMFTHIVVSDLMEADIENNLETIQKALNVVFEKRLEMVKTALVRTSQTTSDPRVLEFAKAVRQVEEFAKEDTPARNQYFYGAPWKESNYRRDPGGRFAVKVSHTMKHPLSRETAEAAIGSYGPEELTREQRAQYQDEYRQVAGFLQNVVAMGGVGNHDVMYHLRDRAGHQYTKIDNTGGIPEDMLKNGDTQLVAIEAKPTTLTAGGAAFGLANSMGRSMSPEAIERVSAVLPGRDEAGTLTGPVPAFTEGWQNAGNARESNSRLFNRLEDSGSFLGSIGPKGSKIQMAGKFAQIVGQYGPEAEKVIGPTARKTGYRYRGTEKIPDEELVSVYGRQIMDAKKYGITEKEADKRLAGFGTAREQARGDYTSFQTRRMTGGRGEPIPHEAAAPEPNQISRYRAHEQALESRSPTWAEQGAGSAIVADYLRRKVPSKELYKLHVEAGNTPPSEGIIINSEGQLAVQAVGYGDDHYLPFNLKNLSSLKGGEYIRNRSVGGLTAEDVYTGLITGARRVTVVSRSGTFSMEFSPDFRGGRRHNDKARRMTSRYEQLLDAVQSGQVDRAQVPKVWKDAIKQEVLTDPYYANVPKTLQRQEINDRIKEFKENPEIEGRDEDRAEKLSLDMEARAARGEIPEYTAKEFRRQIFNSLFDMKEVRFRLNGIGYEAALNSLQEQFPYYITDVNTNPTRDKETPEFEMDLGYVEPGRNRPTKARAGLHGTEDNKGEKFSASQADYQRGKTGDKQWKAGAPGAAQAALPTPGAGDTPADTPAEAAARQQRERRDIAHNERVRTEATANALMIRNAINRGTNETITGGGVMPPFMTMTDPEFTTWIGDAPENERTFHQFVEDNKTAWTVTADHPAGIGGFDRDYVTYARARGRLFRTQFTQALGRSFPPTPYSFAEVPPLTGENPDIYHGGARLTDVTHAINNLSTRTPLFTTARPLRDVTDADLEKEVTRIATLRRMRNTTPKSSIADVLRQNREMSPDASADNRIGAVLDTDKNMDEHLERIHRVRYLREMEGEAQGAGTEATTGFTRGGGGGGTAPPDTERPTRGFSPPRGEPPAPRGAGEEVGATPEPEATPEPTGASAGLPTGVLPGVPPHVNAAINMSANRIADLNHQVSSEANEGRRNALVRQKTAVENFRRYVMRNKHAADLDSPEKLENVLKEVHGDDYGNWIRGTFGLEPLDELDEYGPREPSST